MIFEKFSKKNILIAGGTGMVGQQLLKILLDMGSNVRIVSLDGPELLTNSQLNNIEFIQSDLSILDNCEKACDNIDIVFSLLGSTGSPKTNFENPATFMYANTIPSMNLLEGARKKNVNEYLYTSTYGVYSHGSEMSEGNIWSSTPSENDKYAGYAKRMGELQIEAYKKQYKWKKLYIVRPANIYGPYANFNDLNSMVVPSLIKKFCSGSDKVEIWGDGSPIRDFIYSYDVAKMMVDVVTNEILQPVNLGSGSGTSIKDLALTIQKSPYLTKDIKIEFDTSKPNGDPIRVLDMTFANENKIKSHTSLKIGINETIKWYLENSKSHEFKYNAFDEK